MPQSEPYSVTIAILERVAAARKVSGGTAELASPLGQLLRGAPLATAHAARETRAVLVQCRQALRTDPHDIELWNIYFALLAELREYEAN
jgi:hypothetical protein